eukprot:4962665-Lingulodinium_polyedra.AAC.1
MQAAAAGGDFVLPLELEGGTRAFVMPKVRPCDFDAEAMRAYAALVRANTADAAEAALAQMGA